MTIYYVKSIGGSDGADGLTAGNSWATVEYADSQVSAGDTVWLSPGVHHIDNPWLIATTGTIGNPIAYKGDVAGGSFAMTKGEVILMPKTYANDDEDGFIWPVLRHWMYRRDVVMGTGNDALVSAEGTEYIEFHNIIFGPATSRESRSHPLDLVIGSSGATQWSAEGWKLIECTWMGNDYALYSEMINVETNKTDADVSDGEGLLIDRCMIPGVLDMRHDESATQECDLKNIVQSTVFFGHGGAFGTFRDFDDTFEVGGTSFYNNTLAYTQSLQVVGTYAKHMRHLHNCLMQGWQTNAGSSIHGRWTGSDSKNIIAQTWALNGFHSLGNFNVTNMHLGLGNDADILHRGLYGWSPWLPWEPVNDGGTKTYGAGGFDSYTFPTYDIYGYPIDAAEGVGFFMIDGSYEAVSAGVDWTDTPDGIDAFDTYLPSDSYATTNPSLIQAAGCDLSDIVGWCDDMTGVAVRTVIGDPLTADQMQVEIEYLAEGLLDEIVLPIHESAFDNIVYPVAPAAGWTRDALAKLRVKYLYTVGGTARLYETIVAPHMQHSTAIGAVASPTKMVKEDTVVYTGGGSSGRIASLGYWQKAMYLETGTHTFTVYARYESEYTGTLPTLEVEAPEDGNSDSDVMVAAADTWEQLSVEIILAEARTVVLRLHSYNTGEGGFCYFDDLETTTA